jgi:hypothetical protein
VRLVVEDLRWGRLCRHSCAGIRLSAGGEGRVVIGIEGR